MLGEILRPLAVTSLAGSALTAIIVLCKPFTKRIFGYAWHYYIWLAVLLVMLLPVRFHIPQNAGSNIVYPAANRVQNQRTQVFPQPADMQWEIADHPSPQTSEPSGAVQLWQLVYDNIGGALGFLWLTGACGMLFVYMVGYLRLIAKIHRSSVPVSCSEIKEYSGKKISVRVYGGSSSPFMLGIFRPTLILPDRDLSREQLRNILLHEMTHFRRKDIIYKWLAVFVKCMHWFNPVIYYVVRQINTECEISCDLAVVGRMNEDEQMGYVHTILSLLSGNKTKAIPFTTGMTGNKKVLKRRFEEMKNKRNVSKIMSALSAALAAVLLTTTVFASGVLSDLAADDYTIKIDYKGKRLELANKPFIANNTVYMPLRELLNMEGITDITYTANGYVTFLIYSETPIVYRGLEYDFWVNRVQIGNVCAYIAGHSGGTTENIELRCAPILKNDVTYVPYDLFAEIAMSGQGVFGSLAYTVYDKNGNEAKEMEIDVTRPSEDVLMSDPYGTAGLLFRALYNSDFETMKRYCTESCAEKFIGTSDVFGMKSAQLYSLSGLRTDTITPDRVKIGAWLYRKELSEASANGIGKNADTFYMIMQKQPDGRYLIDEFTAE